MTRRLPEARLQMAYARYLLGDAPAVRKIPAARGTHSERNTPAIWRRCCPPGCGDERRRRWPALPPAGMPWSRRHTRAGRCATAGRPSA